MNIELWQGLAAASGLSIIGELVTGTFMLLSVALGLAIAALYVFLFGSPGSIVLVLMVAISSALSARLLRSYLAAKPGQPDVNDY